MRNPNRAVGGQPLGSKVSGGTAAGLPGQWGGTATGLPGQWGDSRWAPRSVGGQLLGSQVSGGTATGLPGQEGLSDCSWAPACAPLQRPVAGFLGRASFRGTCEWRKCICQVLGLLDVAQLEH